MKKNNLDKIAAKLPVETDLVIDKFIHDVDAHATASTPVDTGKLKNSKKVTKGRIHWSAEYAGHVNFGTRNTPAQPFASDAVEKCLPGLEEALADLESRII